MIKIVLLRHGESIWNKENLFTGWHDVDLSDQGRHEAAQAGRELLKEGIVIDMAFTSVLKRAIRTLWTVLAGEGVAHGGHVSMPEFLGSERNKS